MAATEDGVHTDSGRGGLSGQYYCRCRHRCVLLLLVAVLLVGQFSLNMLFYRSSNSLFYVNTTSSHGSLLFNSKLWLTNSQLPWLQSLPRVSFNKTESPSSSTSINDSELWEKGRQIKTGKASYNFSTNYEKKTVRLAKESLNETLPGELPLLADLPTTYEKKDVQNSAGSRDQEEVSGNKGSQMDITKSIVIVDKPLCPPVPPKLVGVVKVNKSAPSLEEQERNHPELAPGGHFLPTDCIARHKVAIIIPYRDRVYHLSVLLNHLHPILQRQQVDYTIFVVEQKGSGKFNRAMLMNVGALEALKHYPFKCFIFHDVDLLLEDDRNLYTCPEQPRHMSIAINSMKYRLPYNDIFGGVSAMTVEQFRIVNGFSNKFWGWGGEDDDMSNRIKYHGFFISRYPANVGRYTMLSHKKDNPNPRRYQYLHEGKKRYISDGLNSVKYRLLDTQLRRLYTWVYVDLFPS